MQQSSYTPSSLNKLTLDFKCNAHLPTNSTLVFSNMLGAYPVTSDMAHNLSSDLIATMPNTNSMSYAPALLARGISAGIALPVEWRTEYETSYVAVANSSICSANCPTSLLLPGCAQGNTSNGNTSNGSNDTSSPTTETAAKCKTAFCSPSNCSCSSFGVVSKLSEMDCGCSCLALHSNFVSEMHVRIPYGLVPDEAYRLTFFIGNPNSAQASPAVKCSVLGDVPVFAKQVLKASGISAPLAVVSRMYNASISQSTPNAGEWNTISISFAAQDAFKALDEIRITISGLLTLSSPPSGDLPIHLLNGSRTSLAHTAAWNLTAGQLVSIVKGTCFTGTKYLLTGTKVQILTQHATKATFPLTLSQASLSRSKILLRAKRQGGFG